MKYLIVLLVVTAVIVLLRKRRKGSADPVSAEASVEMQRQLEEHVAFYRELDDTGKTLFRQRVQHFLDTTRITPVKDVVVTSLDRLYVACSAIIPIFHFTDWGYNNLDEVLIYPGVFNKEFSMEDAERNVIGMVGDGAMHRMMILSQPALRAGFEQHGAGNTGIHEFAHLLDKADGATDGVPEYMIPHELIQPWMRQMHRTIREIRNGESDLNPYAGTNEAEFFAVLSEYFFQKPELLQEHHPELYDVLEATYKVNRQRE
ncbi:M90 family metallopeptidase [Rurimicrobium arvi]|uniref:Zinc-dependent peptidase n=1 Tax=Rurimicrobium arvi TaxID=2049916 RepID=A0ABP8MWA0_9BACT